MDQEQEQKRDLRFRPLNPGLGFHPFSDGLPYAPVAKTRGAPPMATVAAGAPRFQFPAAKPAAAVTPPAVQSAPQIARHQDAAPGIFYLFKRVLAYVLDLAIHLSLGAASLYFVIIRQEMSSDLFANPGVVLIAGAFLAFFSWAVITAEEVAFGTSLGKRAFGLWIDGSPTALLVRSLLFVISLGFMGMGLVWALFRRDRRCWHDAVTGVQPSEFAQL